MDTWGISGPRFLLLYVILLAGTVLVAVVAGRRALAGPGEGAVAPARLDPYEAAYLNGRPEQALIQLQNLKKRDDLDFYARARIDARIAAITPEVLELRRQGIRDPDVERR